MALLICLKDLKFTLFYFVLLFTLSTQEDCEHLAPLQKAVNTCLPADKKGDDDYLENNKCFWACYLKAFGFFDENDRISLDLVNAVFNSTIKDPESKEKFATLHGICVPDANKEKDTCDMSYTYHICLKSKKEMNELINTKYCEEDRRILPGY